MAVAFVQGAEMILKKFYGKWRQELQLSRNQLFEIVMVFIFMYTPATARMSRS